jgi:hypothetical protein
MSQTSISASMPVAYSGMLADASPKSTLTRFNEEASAEIPFGSGVIQGSGADGALLPVDENSAVLGIALHSHAYHEDDLGDDGLVADATFTVLTQGRVYVQVEDAVVPGDRGWCRAVTAGAEVAGAWRGTDDGTDTIDCTKQTKFVTAASAAGFAVLEVNFMNKP